MKFVCVRAGVCLRKSDLYYKCMYVYRVQRTEHGQMTEYFNKCLAIYKSIWPFYISLWIDVMK